MASWKDLEDELAAWGDDSRPATLWWRDDDATRLTADLQRVLDLSSAFDTPVALAVIPRDADASLADHLGPRQRVAVLQHGFAHFNHAPAGERDDEYGRHRPLDQRLAEIARGWRLLEGWPRALPVFVAPWNRMDPDLIPALPEAGLKGISTLGPREAGEAAPGVRRANVHVDIMDWHGTGGFVGDDRALDQITSHLTARRCGSVDRHEPTGVMTHHAFHDEGCWRFLAQLFERTRHHSSVRWLHGREAFWP